MLWLILFLTLARPIFAQTDMPSPTPTISPSANDEIQKLREVVSQKVAEKLRQITNPASTKKAFIGKVIQIDANSMTVDSQGNSRTFSINTDTVYIDIKGNKIKLTNIKVGQDILVMGSNNSDNTGFAAKRIIIVDVATIFYKRTVVVGKIVDVSRTSAIFSLIPIKNKNDLFQIKTDDKSVIFDSHHQKLKVTDLKSGQKIIAVLKPDPKISKTYNAINLIDLDYSPSPTPTKKP